MNTINAEFLHHCLASDLKGVTDCLTQGGEVNTVSEDGNWSGLTISAHDNSTHIQLLFQQFNSIDILCFSVQYFRLF